MHASATLLALHRSGLCGTVVRRSPLLRKTNIKACLEFATSHATKSESIWENILFSDETKVCLYPDYVKFKSFLTKLNWRGTTVVSQLAEPAKK